jgi:hypothetical protein
LGFHIPKWDRQAKGGKSVAERLFLRDLLGSVLFLSIAIPGQAASEKRITLRFTPKENK